MRQLFVLILLFVPSVTFPEDKPLSKTRSFALALGLSPLTHSDIESLGEYDLIVVDGETTTKSQIRKLKKRGCIVLAYLSVGTIESGRGWYDEVKSFRLEKWRDWNEYYADVSKSPYRKTLLRVADKFLRKQFDGLFLDNVDMIETHAAQKVGMYSLVSSLSRAVKAKHGYLFMQNGDSFILRIAKYFDGWNKEDLTSTYNFESSSYERVDPSSKAAIAQTFRRLRQKGLFTTVTDYAPSSSDEIASGARELTCSLGAVPFISTINLDALPDKPITCSY